MEAGAFASGYRILLFIGVVFAALMFALIWRSRHAAGSPSLLAKISGEILWMFFYALHLSGFVHPASEPYFWSKMMFLGVVVVPAAFLVWTAHYTHRDAWVTRRAIVLLSIEPVLFNLIIWTDPWHGWFSGTFKTTGRLGIAFWLHTLYSYALLLTAAGMQLVHFLKVQPVYRLQAFLVLMTLPVSCVANILTIAFMQELKLDFSPLGFLAVGAILVYVQSRHRLFDILPVARDKVMDDILDGVVVLDNDHRIIDMNPAARAMLGTTTEESHGRPIQSVLPDFNDSTLNASPTDNQTIEWSTRFGSHRCVDITLSVMYNRRKERVGKLVLLRDISRIKQIETALRDANKELLRKIEENEALQAKFKEQAIRDPLTGLYNRRFLEETLSHELAKSERNHQPLSLAMIDLDCFKQINDTYGHDAGDIVLIHLADVLEKRIRQGDIVCRFGGEEFIVVMPGASLLSAADRIDALRNEFSRSTITIGGREIRATFSAGLAAYPYQGLDDKSLIAEADKALYEAKQAGRNRLVTADAL